MDQLEVLKTGWITSEKRFEKLSYADIYQMVLKRSSSIAKWIFITCLLEFAFFLTILFLIPIDSTGIIEVAGLSTFITFINIIHFGVIAFFVYLHYKNYQFFRKNNTIELLKRNITKTIRTLKHFVVYNVLAFVLISLIMNIKYYLHIDDIYGVMYMNSSGVSKDNFAVVFFGTQLAVTIVFLIVLAVFYYLLYGSLHRKLRQLEGLK